MPKSPARPTQPSLAALSRQASSSRAAIRAGYSGGRFNRSRPNRTVDEGGIGSIQINARYDYLDLTDAGVVGGEQNLFGLSMIWTPIDHARFMINYSHIQYDDAAIALPSGSRDYNVNVVGARAEIDF